MAERPVNKRIEKLLVLVIIAASSFALPISYVGQSVVSSGLNAQASKPPCANFKFHNLNRYKHNWSKVFRDKEVAPVLRRLLKNDYRLLIWSLKSVSYPDSLSYVDRKGVLTLRVLFQGWERSWKHCWSSNHVETSTPAFWIAIGFFILATTKNTSTGCLQ